MLKQICAEVFKYAPIGLVVVDNDTRLVAVNDYIFSYFSMQKQPFKGRQFGNLFGCAAVFGTDQTCGEAEACFECNLRGGMVSVLSESATLTDVSLSHSFIIGGQPTVKWFKITASPTHAVNGQYAVLSFVDITKEKQYEALLQRELTLDLATGVINKHNLLGLLADMAKYAADYATVSVGMIDLDDFKNVNDRFGHLKGDEVLCVFSQTSRLCTRLIDVVGRFGGEEFMFVFPGVDIRLASRIIKRIQKQLTSRLAAQSLPDVTFSAGFVELRAPELELMTADDIISAADSCLYKAKRAGKHRFVSKELMEPLVD
jgi:diguanylate cyclase (GGDEF)-like protein